MQEMKRKRDTAADARSGKTTLHWHCDTIVNIAPWRTGETCNRLRANAALGIGLCPTGLSTCVIMPSGGNGPTPSKVSMQKCRAAKRERAPLKKRALSCSDASVLSQHQSAITAPQRTQAHAEEKRD
jgi:hypothetical protein